MNSSKLLAQSLKHGFIDKDIAGSQLDPKLIVNQPEKQDFLLNTLQEEVESCRSFFFSVAFITQDGLNSIKTQLADLAQRGISGRLLTSTYLGFNDPFVFESLLRIPNLDVRISSKNGFHSKGYLFERSDYYTFIIGSSNLTMSALKLNYEWNIRLSSLDYGEVILQAKNHLEDEWSQSKPLDSEWIQKYAETYQQPKTVVQPDMIEDEPVLGEYIVPNKMQKMALKNLQELRETGAKKGLVISATGTGKTYLAAFDVAQFAPRRFLFIVHREQILKKAKESFKKILGGNDSDYGILSGNSKETEAKYLFATIQTISKDNYLEQFPQDYFDYVLVDEVHKAGAGSYQKVINYLDPKFLLGMTATPERTDGFNIFELFDYNIAYEIRLQEALEEDLLCPFNYFGVTDYEKNGQIIETTSDLAELVEEERVRYLIEKINYYGCYQNDAKGLVFCSRKDEAKKLADLFSSKGIRSVYLSGEDDIDEREKQIERLEDGIISYIFTVDIFNEGVDIPKINQIILLRNTQSSIIFIQQLGRGLRKDPSKKFVTVIDFIGNYRNNYMIPMALSGDVSGNKNNMRKDTFDTSYISGLSAVNFEAVAKEKIYSAIDSAKLDSVSALKKAFFQLKMRLNRVPYLLDFKESNVLDPQLVATKESSYYGFLVKIHENEGTISEADNQLMTFFSKELLSGMRKQELVVIRALVGEINQLSTADLQSLFIKNGLTATDEVVNSVINVLTIDFYAGGQAKSYHGAAFIQIENGQVISSAQLKTALNNEYFKFLLMDALKTAEKNSEKYDIQNKYTLYQKYKRRDVLRLGCWKQQMVDQNIGGYTYKDGKFAIFMTIEKGEDFKGAQIAYEDTILDQNKVLYYTKAPRHIDSPEVKILRRPENWVIYLFAKKSDDEGKDFYFLGQVTPEINTIKEVVKETKDGDRKSVVELIFSLKDQLPSTFFKYLTTH